MIKNVPNNPVLAATKICTLRKEVRCLSSQLAQKVLSTEIEKHGTHLSESEVGDDIRQAFGVMEGPVTAALQNGEAPEALELWRLHSQHITEVDKNGGKGKGQKMVKYHPLLMNWTIVFLARTSVRVYAEVAKIMILPYISHVYRKTAKLISLKWDKAFGLHINTIWSIHECARRKKWMWHQRIGGVVQDSANINATVEHDYVSNMIKGGNPQTHCVATLPQMFQTMAQKMRDAQRGTRIIEIQAIGRIPGECIWLSV
jgi:hypothetical protein